MTNPEQAAIKYGLCVEVSGKKQWYAFSDLKEGTLDALGVQEVVISLSPQQAREMIKRIWRLLPAAERPCP